MKRIQLFFGSAVVLFALSNAGCTEKAAGLPEISDKVAAGSTAAVAGVSAKWADIKDCSYEMRANFQAGLKAMHAQVDAQVDELGVKRRAFASSVSTTNWDFAMKEVESSRTALKSAGEDLAKASSETWTQQKDKVGVAWVRTQDAYAKVKASVTQ